MLGTWKSSIDRRSPGPSRPERRPWPGEARKRELARFELRAAIGVVARQPAVQGRCLQHGNRREPGCRARRDCDGRRTSCSSGGSARAAAWTSSSDPREAEPFLRRGSRSCCAGASPATDASAWSVRTHATSATPRPGVVVARPAASEPRSRLGRTAFAARRALFGQPLASAAGDRAAAAEVEGARGLLERRHVVGRLRHRGEHVHPARRRDGGLRLPDADLLPHRRRSSSS